MLGDPMVCPIRGPLQAIDPNTDAPINTWGGSIVAGIVPGNGMNGMDGGHHMFASMFLNSTLTPDQSLHKMYNKTTFAATSLVFKFMWAFAFRSVFFGGVFWL